jgi:hypothetical protein
MSSSDAFGDHYLREVGRFTVNIAFAEFALDACNLLLDVGYGGDQIVPLLPENSLKSKIDYFRKVHRQSPAVEDACADKALATIDRLATLRDWRRTAIHGLHIGPLMKDYASGLVLRARHIPRNMVADHYKNFTPTEINTKAIEARSVGADLLQYALELGGPPPDDAD